MGSGVKAPQTPGGHVLTVTARVTVFAGEMDDRTANVLEQHDVELSAKVDVRAR
jgi:hypothetical protein